MVSKMYGWMEYVCSEYRTHLYWSEHLPYLEDYRSNFSGVQCAAEVNVKYTGIHITLRRLF
jgi:hypothetical protein